MDDVLLGGVEAKALLEGVESQGKLLLSLVNFAHQIVGRVKGGLDGQIPGQISLRHVALINGQVQLGDRVTLIRDSCINNLTHSV